MEPGSSEKFLSSAPAYGIWLLVVASVISWRQGVIFDGGLDAVVLAKAAVAGVAAVAAVIAAASAKHRRSVGGMSLGLIALIVAISTLGAFAGNELASAIVLAARIGLLSITILFIVSANSTVSAISSLLAAMATIGLVAGVAGIGTLASEGRLRGGFPPLAPNELAGLLLAPLVGLFFIMVSRKVTVGNSVLFAVLLSAIYLTGSRTGLAALAISLALVVLMSPRISRAVAIGALVAIPIGYALVVFTDLIGEVVYRGEGTSRLLTLNSRTVAWEVVLNIPSDTWRWWIGAGLALKVIGVNERFRDEQVLDSSWISSLAQSGVIGTALLATLVVVTLIRVWRAHPLRPVMLPLLALILVRSFLENGLVESSVTFTLFFTIAIVSEKRTPQTLQPVYSSAASARPLQNMPRMMVTTTVRGRDSIEARTIG